MTADRLNSDCPECVENVGRRDFVKTVGAAALAAGSAGLLLPTRSPAAEKKAGPEETVKELYASLSDNQRKQIAFGFDHQLRTRINANWAITRPEIESDFYSKAQQELIDNVVRGVTSEDGYERLIRQMNDDAGGFGSYHVALFGKPGTGKFQFELTGRHLTLRADGDSKDMVAFGGPLVYGHGIGNPADNLYYYQTKATNEVFKALDEKQRKAAMIAQEPRESAVKIQGAGGKFSGISVGSLSSDQQALVSSVIKTLLAPYREQDSKEAMAILAATGGVGKLNMAFYTSKDLRNDKIWDVWRLEGPGFVSHFRGAPHVHAYINIAKKA